MSKEEFEIMNKLSKQYAKTFGYMEKDSSEEDYKAGFRKALTLYGVSQQRELLIAFDNMREFDIKHDDIEESVDYFLKNKESYL